MEEFTSRDFCYILKQSMYMILLSNSRYLFVNQNLFIAVPTCSDRFFKTIDDVFSLSSLVFFPDTDIAPIAQGDFSSSHIEGAYMLLLQEISKVREEEKQIGDYVISKGGRLVVDGGDCSSYFQFGVRENALLKVRQLEKSFGRPCSLFFSCSKFSWSHIAPFILKTLLQMSENSCLFFDFPSFSSCSVSSVLSDILWGLQQHALVASASVRFIPIFRSLCCRNQGILFEVPCLNELEKLMPAFRFSSTAGCAFFEERTMRPLCGISQRKLIQEALLSNMSVTACFRRFLRIKQNMSLESIYDLEPKLMMLEAKIRSGSADVDEADFKQFGCVYPTSN